MFDFKKVFKSAVHSFPDEGVLLTTKGNRQRIESFYKALAEGLSTLESSLSPDSLSFRVEWLQIAVSFLHRVHYNTFLLVEKSFAPIQSRSALQQGPKFLSEYLDLSISLLEICNDLKEGLNQVERRNFYLELALQKLTSASEILQERNHASGEVSLAKSSNHLKPLNEARQELDRVDSKDVTSYMWMGVLTNKISDPGNNRRKGASLDIPRISSWQQPDGLSPRKRKLRGISLVLYDVHVVTSFISYVLLWVLTGEFGDQDFSSTVDVLEPSLKLQRTTSWPAFMFRLKEKVLEQSFQDLQSSTSQVKLLDMKNFHSSLSSLRAELEAGFNDGKMAPDTAFAKRIKTLLEQEKQKLAELNASLEGTSAQLNDMFREIRERRKKLLDKFERSLYHQATI